MVVKRVKKSAAMFSSAPSMTILERIHRRTAAGWSELVDFDVAMYAKGSTGAAGRAQFYARTRPLCSPRNYVHVFSAIGSSLKQTNLVNRRPRGAHRSSRAMRNDPSLYQLSLHS